MKPLIHPVTSQAAPHSQYNLRQSPLASINSFQKLGVSRNLVWRLLTEEFSFPAEFRDCLSEYRLLYWSPEYLFSELYKNPQFKLQPSGSDTQFLVIFHNCGIYKLRQAKQVACSFRAPVPELELPAYVLLSPSTK